MTYLLPDEVGRVLDVFVRDFIVDVPAKHDGGEYLIPLGDLEYALSFPDQEWLEELTEAINSGE